MALAQQPNERNQVFLGTFIHSKTLGELEYLHGTAVFVDRAGKIAAVEADCDLERAKGEVFGRLGWSADEVEVHDASSSPQSSTSSFFFPGFVDTHVHASQYPNVGIFGKTTLLDWLNRYTFPMEASLGADLARARRVYARCIRRTLAHGTTAAAYFTTISVPATSLMADLCLALGQRALVGRVCMDHLGPDYYLDESAEASANAARESAEYILSLEPDRATALVGPILTPRFAPACSAGLMDRLAALQRETGLPLQTHLSENPGECQLVKQLFPSSQSYTHLYDSHGLLTPSTILAHAIHLSDAEADLIAARGAKVAHCPCSNSAITSGEARVRWLLDRGVDVGLGTDMSGGYSPSVLEAARLASLVSRHLAMEVRHPPGSSSSSEAVTAPVSDEERERAKLTVDEVLFLATRGGAKVIGLQDRIGAFEVGMDFDAQLIGLGVVENDDDGSSLRPDCPDTGNVDIFGWEAWDERVAKWVFNGDDRNTKRVWVRGRLVHVRKDAS